MEQYIVSARKYRPATFETVVGQRALTETLRNAIRTNHLAHAYLFCGPRGVGKTTCARIFAKTINCLNPTADHDACNECESCRAFNEQRSFNIHELDAASNNSVEDIRSLIDQVRIPPQVGKYSVYIIDEVHMLSAGAFNALLKTLEEPPSYAIFILATTEKHKVLPTILSRCQVYDFSRITVADTIAHLQYVAQKEGITASEEALSVVAQKADGGMRDALSIFDQLVAFCGSQITYEQAINVLNVLDTEYYFRLVDAILRCDVSSALLILNDVLDHGFDGGHFVTGFASHLRNLLVSKDPQTVVLLETSDSIRKHYAEQAAQCHPVFLYKALDIINTCDINYRTARNKRLTIELTLIKLSQLLAQPQAAPQAPATPASAPQPAPIAKPAPAPQTAPKPAPMPQAAPKQVAPQSAPIPQGAPVITPVPSLPKIPSMPGASSPQSSQSPQPSATTPNAANTQSAPGNRPFTDDQLKRAWAGLRSLLASDQRMVAMISSLQPQLLPNNVIYLALVNPFQETAIKSQMHLIRSYLAEQLQNSNFSVEMEYKENQHPETQVAYTAKEKLKVLTDQNPHVSQLTELLELVMD